MGETLLLIRVSHPSPKVNCSAVSAPLSLGSCWCSLIFNLYQWSVNCVGRKPPPELRRTGGASLPSSGNVLLLLLFLQCPAEFAGFRQAFLSWGFAQGDAPNFAVLNFSFFLELDRSLSLSSCLLSVCKAYSLLQVLQGLPFKAFHTPWLSFAPKSAAANSTLQEWNLFLRILLYQIS